MKTFPYDISIENCSHGELGNGVGNGRTSVKSISLHDVGYGTQSIIVELKESIGNTHATPRFNGKRKM